MSQDAAFGRRAFLGLAAATGAAVAGVGLTAAPSDAAPAATPLWRLATFQALRGQRFAVRGGGSLQLVDVVDRKRAGESAERFLLVFQPQGVSAHGSLLTLQHRSLGTFALGTTAVGRRGRLQAVIDQRRARVQSKEL